MNTPETAATAFGDALVREIRAEMGRQDIRSVRALAQMLGNNHVYWNERLHRAGEKRVAIGMEDLWRLCEVLDVHPDELVRRAREAADEDLAKTAARIADQARANVRDRRAADDVETGEESATVRPSGRAQPGA